MPETVPNPCRLSPAVQPVPGPMQADRHLPSLLRYETCRPPPEPPNALQGPRALSAPLSRRSRLGLGNPFGPGRSRCTLPSPHGMKVACRHHQHFCYCKLPCIHACGTVTCHFSISLATSPCPNWPLCPPPKVQSPPSAVTTIVKVWPQATITAGDFPKVSFASLVGLYLPPPVTVVGEAPHLFPPRPHCSSDEIAEEWKLPAATIMERTASGSNCSCSKLCWVTTDEHEPHVKATSMLYCLLLQ